MGWWDFLFLTFLNSGTRLFLIFGVSTPAPYVSARITRNTANLHIRVWTCRLIDITSRMCILVWCYLLPVTERGGWYDTLLWVADVYMLALYFAQTRWRVQCLKIFRLTMFEISRWRVQCLKNFRHTMFEVFHHFSQLSSCVGTNSCGVGAPVQFGATTIDSTNVNENYLSDSNSTTSYAMTGSNQGMFNDYASRASVAQLVRARDCQSLGRRFDSV